MAKPDPKSPVTNETFFGTIEHLVDRMDEMMDKKLEPLKKGQQKLEAGQVEQSRKIDDIRADLSDTPTRKEFNELRGRLDRLERRFHSAN